ncbi:MAG: hypothetical protein HKN44_03430 [Ilumatobacter sp.]|nr:hypothetical protein [Ilumatobacter sp.]
MTVFHHGDRIRYATTDDDGFPVVRYGFVGGFTGETGPVVVMLDGELGGDVVEVEKIQPVHICNVTLTLEGVDLIEEPCLRQGLVNLWAAEAETAGLQITTVRPLGTGVRDANNGYSLAELSSAGEQYVLRANICPQNHDAVTVHADHPRP